MRDRSRPWRRIMRGETARCQGADTAESAVERRSIQEGISLPSHGSREGRRISSSASKRLILRAMGPWYRTCPRDHVRIRQVRGTGERDGVSVPSPPIRRAEHPALGLPGHTVVDSARALREESMKLEKDTFRIELRSAKLCMELD